MPEVQPTGRADELDLGARRAADGYFLARSTATEPRPSVPEAGSGDGDGDGDGDWQFCSTFRGAAPVLRDAVLEIIGAAREKVFVTSFILGDDQLIETLVATADRLRGGVYVISELSERSLSRGLAELAGREDKGEEVGQKVEVEKKRFMALTSRGIAVRGHDDCHAKFVVVDDQVAWVGSANLETRAFTEVGEVGVVTTDPPEVQRLARLFARMWLAGCTYELPSSATEDYKVDERVGVPVPFDVPRPAIGPAAAVIWTDDTGQTLLDTIHDVIERAERHVRLASFSLNGMVERPHLLLDPLAAAIARGVTVDLFVRAMNFRARHRRDAGHLHELGVRVVADDLNHAKAVVADDEHGALFSANFDSEHGLEAGSGIETGARLDGTSALQGLRRYLDHAVDQAPYDYVAAPTGRHLDESLRGRWKRRWPLPEKLSIRATSPDWQRLADETGDEPVLWVERGQRSVELLAGPCRFLLRSDGNGSYELRTSGRRGPAASSVLAEWWDARSPDAARGFCPATLRWEGSTDG